MSAPGPGSAGLSTARPAMNGVGVGPISSQQRNDIGSTNTGSGGQMSQSNLNNIVRQIFFHHAFTSRCLYIWL